MAAGDGMFMARIFGLYTPTAEETRTMHAALSRSAGAGPGGVPRMKLSTALVGAILTMALLPAPPPPAAITTRRCPASSG